MRLYKSLVVLLVSVALVSACIPQARPAPTLTPAPTTAPTLTAAPSATPSPAPTATKPPAKAEAWWRDAAVYEIFVRSFYDSNGDGIGDFNGVAQKLDYLSSLGVNTLWLMPIFPTRSYHGYDVVQYDAVNPEYGSLDDFKALLSAAHQRKIKIIIDLVINHTSNENAWFKASAAGDPKYADYYIWSDTDPKYSGPWGETVWHPYGNRFYYGVFDPAMPDLNYKNPAVTQEMYKIADFWLKDVGIDGFRLDGAKHVIEKGQIQENTQETKDWLKAFRAHIKEVKPDALVTGEVWSSLRDIAPYVNGGSLDLAFNFPLADNFMTGLIARSGASVMPGVISSTAIQNNQYGAFLSNHDQTRVMSRVNDDPPRAKTAAAMLLTAPGVPFIYYGEEIGMLGDKPDPQIRNPMQWSADKNAGFTTGTPWEAPKDDYATKNVAAQDKDSASLLNLYRALLKVRGEHPALRTGAPVAMQCSSSKVYAALRAAEQESVLVLVNLNDKPVAAPSLTWASSALKGANQPRLLFGDGAVSKLTVVAPLTVDNQGGVKDYTPITELPAYGILIIQYGQ